MASLDSNYVTYPQLAVVLDGLLVVFLHVVREVVDGDVVVLDILHDLQHRVNTDQKIKPGERTRFLNPRSSLGVKESAFPITGITLTRGERRRISSISISLRLYHSPVSVPYQRDAQKYAYE